MKASRLECTSSHLIAETVYRSQVTMRLLSIDLLSKTQWSTLVTGRYMITMMVLLCYVNLSGGQECTDSVDIRKSGNVVIGDKRLAIIPRLNFTCSGRITSIRARMLFNNSRSNYPFFQVWRPASLHSTTYNKTSEVKLQSDDQLSEVNDNFQTATITLTGNNTIEVHSGDVVGYYHPPDSRYRVLSAITIGYTVYEFSESHKLVDLNNTLFNNSGFFRQPLIQFTFASEASSSGSSDAGATIGGAVGGILFIILIIIIAIIVILYVRKLQKKKVQFFEAAKSSKDSTAHDYQITVAVDNEVNDQSSIVVTSPSKSIYAEPTLPPVSILSTALSNMNAANGPQYETAADWCEISIPLPQEMARSMEEEEVIYSTPCESEGNYGPIYCEPPCDEHKIYAEFEGKRFQKLYHKEIWSLEELGSGEFGVVTHGKWKQCANKEVEVAVKMLNTDASDKDRLRFLQEAAIMCQFDHQNVIKLHGVVTEVPIMIVLEYMSRGDLKNMLMQLQSMNQITTHTKLPLMLLKFCKEIVAGMVYLSGKQFIHRDLAARNILVSENVICKIADFGMSRDLIDENYYITSGGKIPVKWTAPEALHYRKYSVQSDVWSYGCVLYEIWSLGYKPFEELSNVKVLEKVDSGYRLPPPPGCSRTIYRIMMKCWHPDPRSRPQFGQITKLLAGNTGYLLGWSDEDKQIGGEDAMKLGAPLASANNLYYDLQLQYKQTES